MLDLSEMFEASAAEEDPTWVTLVDTIAKAIDPNTFDRLHADPDLLIMDDDDADWLYKQAERVMHALNGAGFLTIPPAAAA